jgi:hypothetical protein
VLLQLLPHQRGKTCGGDLGSVGLGQVRPNVRALLASS